MAEKKQVEAITGRDEDFARWYTDIVKKAELIEYTSVKGCMVIRPYGYAIWENMQRILDAAFKATGHENVSMPMFIPESLLQKEKDHVAASRPRWRGSRTAAARSWRSAFASAQRRRRCSVSITPTSSIPTATCPSCTTSG